MLERFKAQARALKTETYAIYLAALDPRTPWYAKALVLLVVAYAFSPIDLIPDFVPVLGYLDDLVIVPAGIALALKLIPAEVMAESRAAATARHGRSRLGALGAVIIVAVWALALILAFLLVRRWLPLPH